MQSLNTDIDSIGGGGLGGFGNNPLLWLITLGFLKDGSLGGGNNDGKIDCLAQQHHNLSDQIAGNLQSQQFQTLAQAVNAVSTTARDSRDAISAQLTQIAASAAECCCENRVAIQGVNTNIAAQTALLQAEGTRNTQAVLDKLSDNALATKDAEIRRLQDDLQTQTILANMAHGKG